MTKLRILNVANKSFNALFAKIKFTRKFPNLQYLSRFLTCLRFRQIFWTDRDRFEPKIEMAYMDGSQRRTIVNSSMSDQPNHLFLDYANNR